MSLLEEVFGQGFRLALELDLGRAPPGGRVTGQVTLAGGRVPWELRSLEVGLDFVHVAPAAGGPARLRVEQYPGQNLDAGQRLGPGSRLRRRFDFRVPETADPSGSFRLQARAVVSDRELMTASARLFVHPPREAAPRVELAPQQALAARAGARQAAHLPPRRLLRLLEDVHRAALEGQANLAEQLPGLVHLARHPQPRVAQRALAVWETIQRAQPSPVDVGALGAVLSPACPAGRARAVLRSLARFADAGGLALLAGFAEVASSPLRAEVARQIWLEGPDVLDGRRALLELLANDVVGEVRAAAFSALLLHRDDPDVVSRLARAAVFDRSLEVKRACLEALALSHPFGQLDLVLDTFLVLGNNPSALVRRTVAEALPWLPADGRTQRLARALLHDEDPRVRRALAARSGHMEGHPELKDLFVEAARKDPDERVRGRALGGLGRLLPVPDACRLALERVSEDGCEETAWGALELARTEPEEPLAQRLLGLLSTLPLPRVAEAARYELGWVRA